MPKKITFPLERNVIENSGFNNPAFQIYKNISIFVEKLKTMKIKLDTTYKKFEPFEQELPDFTILTGVNGAGKTQLLTGLAKSDIKVVDIQNVNIKYVNNTILSENEVPSNIQQANNRDHFAKSLVLQYSMFNRFGKEKPKPMMTGMSEEAYQNVKHIYEKIARISKKNIEELEENDILNYSAINTSLHQDSIFYHNFKDLFNRYAVKVRDNDLLESQKNKYGYDHLKFLDQKEFVDAYGEAPWDFANRVLKEANINYHFEMPQLLSVSSEIEIILVENLSNRKVSFKDMSSGEKVILSLVFAMYNSQSQVRFPDLILMDEPDASLHPSMIKHFLNVIKNVFVKEKNIKVIITTHSPTTIALADEENIFVVKSPDATIEKTSKDAALKVLTEGVPSFSVNYENRRQIFVESPYDVEYYEKLYAIYGSLLESEISLHFIASGDVQKDKFGIAKNSCDIVIDITTLMRDGGNKFVWGIIDFDNKNESTEFVKVLGEGNRYSTENYFLDPLLIAILLLIEGFEMHVNLGFVDGESYINVPSFDSTRLQTLVDYVLDKVKQNIAHESDVLIDCELLNGKIIKLPSWFLYSQGHDLEAAIKKAFPGLNKYRGERDLKMAVLNKVIAIFKGLASKDLLNILLIIQQ